MEVHDLGAVAVPLMTNVLLWDELEREWRIGHARRLLDLDEVWHCEGSVADVHELITDGMPVPVFSRVTRWARLPPEP